MPANLTPQYLAAEKRFKEATSLPDKIEALQEMMAVIPKHKGTEKLQASLKQKMARLQKDKGKKTAVSKASAIYAVQKEGAGQVVLLGAPNVGKSSLLARLTNASPEVADYPFSTRLPTPGMMPYEDVQIQLVDMPPCTQEFYKPWMGGIVRQADLTLLVADLASDDLLDQVQEVIATLKDSRIALAGISLEGNGDFGDMENCRTLLVLNKADAPGAPNHLQILKEFYESVFEIFPVSAAAGDGIEALRGAIFARLDVIRVYTKAPGKKFDPASAPFVLKAGSTVLDAAAVVHRDLVHLLKSARVWTSPKSKGSVKFDGQLVERSHRLEDGDILELHG